MRAIPKTWTKAEPKYAMMTSGGLAGMQGEAYWDSKGRFRMMTYDPFAHGYIEMGWDYAGQEEGVAEDYLPFQPV